MSDASLACLPFQIFAYAYPKLRQNQNWSYRQAIANTFLKVALKNFTALRIKWPLSLQAHHEKGRFIEIHNAPQIFYKGVTDDQEIKPEIIGATWYPNPVLSSATLCHDESVILHLHGGSYILGDGRIASSQFLVQNLLDYTPCSFVLCPQYRLACGLNGRFPAQLQDAISAYVYLVHTVEIPASRIVLSGDSSGGHLTLALLRYIVEFNDEALLPAPKCGLLWSPWCDVPAARDPKIWRHSPNYKTEFIPASFPEWGANKFLGNLDITGAIEEYVVPIRHPFCLPSPVLLVTGNKEVLFEEHKTFAQRFKEFRRNGDMVELFVSCDVPHDVLMIGWVLGFRKEARECAEMAGHFVMKLPAQSSKPGN